jgi:hypothetical protein
MYAPYSVIHHLGAGHAILQAVSRRLLTAEARVGA